MTGKIIEQSELSGGRGHRVAAHGKRHRAGIDFDVTDFDRPLGQGPLETAQHRFDPRHQFPGAERFRDVIIGAQFQAENAVRFPAFRRQKYHRSWRQRRHLPDLPAQFKAVFARDHDVEDEQGRPLPFRFADDRISGGEHFHREAVRFQVVPYQARNIGIVFNHKDARFHSRYCSGQLCGTPSLAGSDPFDGLMDEIRCPCVILRDVSLEGSGVQH